MDSTAPTESTRESDAQVTSPARGDTRARPTAASLDILPTELLLAIATAVSTSWDFELRLLATMVQVNRRLATKLMPEARRTFCIWSARQLETLDALPEPARAQIETLVIEVRPTRHKGRHKVNSAPDQWQGLRPGAVLHALQCCPAVNELRLTFLAADTDMNRREAFRFPLRIAHDSPFNDTHLDIQICLASGAVPTWSPCRRLVLYGDITVSEAAALALFSHLGLHFPQLHSLYLGPIYMLNETGGQYGLPEIGNPPPTLQYLHVDCALPGEPVPDLPQGYFNTTTEMVTLFRLDDAFNYSSAPYSAELHLMQYICLDWLPPSSSRRRQLFKFLLTLSSLRCLFLAEELYEDAGSRKFVESLVQQLHPKCVDVHKHANRDLIDPVLSEFAKYIENEAGGGRTGVNEP